MYLEMGYDGSKMYSRLCCEAENIWWEEILGEIRHVNEIDKLKKLKVNMINV